MKKYGKFFSILFLALGIICCFSFLPGSKAEAATVSVKNVQKLSGGKFEKRGSSWYYVCKNGSTPAKGLYEIKGKTYYLSSTGRRKYGWQTIEGNRYYFGRKSEGYMYKKCWLKLSSGKVYRLTKSGKMATGLTKVGKKYYYFDKETGERQYGWKKVDGKYRYFGKKSSSGAMYVKKWLTKGKYLYYLTSDGSRATGWKTISGKKYYFSKKGRACRSKKKINGVTYYFDSKTGELLYSGANISNISSDCAILINADTGKVLYDKNSTKKHANASTTKILTCIIALENSNLTDKVKISANAAAAEPTKLYLRSGEKVYMKDLLYAMMLPSANDAAVAVAEYISGSTSKFATLMNRKAKEIGCTSTHFVTPNGLDSGLNHYTTAADLAKIASYAYKNSTFRNIIKTKSYSFKSISGYSYSMKNTNDLLGSMTGVKGMKTGYTQKAGYCYVGVIKSKKGNTYICVTLGAKTSTARWSDAKALLNYAYKK